MFEQIQYWLQNTILGIIVLGAFGSLLAISLLRIIQAIRNKILPLPFKIHHFRKIKQAYLLGYSHAFIHEDKTGKRLVAFLCFHVVQFLASMALFLFCTITFSLIIALQSRFNRASLSRLEAYRPSSSGSLLFTGPTLNLSIYTEPIFFSGKPLLHPLMHNLKKGNPSPLKQKIQKPK